MTIIGEKGKPIRLNGKLSGAGDDVPVAGFNITNTVGAIPTCSVTIPIEFLDKLKTEDDEGEAVIYTLEINGFPVFKGLFTGDGHEITGTSCGAQVSLLHPASQIDTGQIVAQDLHSSSSIDFSYIIRTKGFTSGASSNVHLIDFYKGGNLIEDIKSGIVAAMTDQSSSTTNSSGDSESGGGNEAAIKAVASILAVHGGSLAEGISGSLTSTINEYVRQIVGNSLVGRTSMWDLMSSVLSTFGILLVCDCFTGMVYAIPDVTGMKPPDSNKISGRVEITAARASSSIVRNVGQVTLFSGAMTNEATSGEGPPVAFISYPETKKSGSELGLTVPGWLNPLAQPLPGDALLGIQRKLAQTYYFIEKNKMKTAAISTAIAPLATPGTMISVEPYSAMRPLSDMNVTAIERTYVGYLHQVSHIFDSASKQIYSVLSVRNYTSEDGAELTEEHALFSDAKCPELL